MTTAAKPQELASTLFFQKMRAVTANQICRTYKQNSYWAAHYVELWTKTLFSCSAWLNFFPFVSESIDAAKSQKCNQCLHLRLFLHLPWKLGWLTTTHCLCADLWGFYFIPFPSLLGPFSSFFSSPCTFLILPYISSFLSTPALPTCAYFFYRLMFLVNNTPLHRGML